MTRDATTRAQNKKLDEYYGSRIRLARMSVGLSQEKLAEACSITFQQIQKYEKGFNRVSMSTLQRIADATDKPVTFFFNEIGEDESTLEEATAINRCLATPDARTSLMLFADASQKGREAALAVLRSHQNV